MDLSNHLDSGTKGLIPYCLNLVLLKEIMIVAFISVVIMLTMPFIYYFMLMTC